MADLEDLLEGAGLKNLWIQEAVKSMKKGAFTKQSLRHGETPKEYASEVLEHPEKHTVTTRRRAQFLKNVLKRGRGTPPGGEPAEVAPRTPEAQIRRGPPNEPPPLRLPARRGLPPAPRIPVIVSPPGGEPRFR